MNSDELIQLLESKGWKKIVQNREYMNFNFDVIGERWFTLTKWRVLVKFIDRLDEKNVPEVKEMYSTISTKSKSWIWGKCFLLCVIAKSIGPSIIEGIKRDSFGLFGVFRIKGGGGNIFLVDLENKKVYGEVPTLPYDVHKYSNDLKEVLGNLLS